jgi:DNA-binding NarL/FixJ family response regulator
MAQLIGQQTDLEVCGEAENAEQALRAVASSKPHVVLVDVTLPGKPGLELVKDLRTAYPEVNVLVVSMHDESLYAERMLRAGARGYLMKNAGGDSLIEAIRSVLAGKVYVSAGISARLLNSFSGPSRRENGIPLNALTDREFEVFQVLGQGMTTREIGARLHMSAKTVETHRLHIRTKLGLKNGPELIRYAIRWAGASDLL